MRAIKLPKHCHLTGLFAGMLLCATTAYAQTLEVSVEVPQLQVAEYHRPYIAIWIATPNQRAASNLTVWYDTGLADMEGTKWLKDLRQWWRRAGRSLEMPVDGVSAATRPPGKHTVDFSDKASELQPGDYLLLVEVVREVGGREMLEIPFTWPPSNENTLHTSGETEVGSVELNLRP